MADKNVTIKVPGADGKEEMLPRTIAPGVTAADVMRQLGKNPAEWILSLPGGGKVFAQSDTVYGQVEDGGKLVLTPKMEAGGCSPASLLSRLSMALSTKTSDSERRVRIVHEPVPVLRITHQEPIAIRPAATPVWQEQEWRRCLTGYAGMYRTPHGSWEGRIETGIDGVSCVLIKSPPSAIKAHPKYPCFVYRGDDWFQLHWENEAPRTVDEAIVNMERILGEAFRTEGRQAYAIRLQPSNA